MNPGAWGMKGGCAVALSFVSVLAAVAFSGCIGDDPEPNGGAIQDDAGSIPANSTAAAERLLLARAPRDLGLTAEDADAIENAFLDTPKTAMEPRP